MGKDEIFGRRGSWTMELWLARVSHSRDTDAVSQTIYKINVVR